MNKECSEHNPGHYCNDCTVPQEMIVQISMLCNGAHEGNPRAQAELNELISWSTDTIPADQCAGCAFRDATDALDRYLEVGEA